MSSPNDLRVGPQTNCPLAFHFVKASECVREGVSHLDSQVQWSQPWYKRLIARVVKPRSGRSQHPPNASTTLGMVARNFAFAAPLLKMKRNQTKLEEKQESNSHQLVSCASKT